MAIPVFKPSIKRRDMDAVLTCMVSDEIGPGKLTSEFQSSMADYLFRAGSVAFREPLRALDVCLDTLGLERGDKVVLSPLSPAYYLRVLQRKEIHPIYVDVDPDSACLSYAETEKALQDESPKAILLHYPCGLVPETERFVELGIPVVEDITTSLGGHTGENKCGSLGKLALASFEYDGIISTAGGAAVFAKNKRDLGEIRKRAGLYAESCYMPDINAAFGLSQLKQIESLLEKRRDIARHYDRALMKSKHRSLLQSGDAEGAYYTFPVLLRSGLKDVQKYARKNGIATAPAFAGSGLAENQSEEHPCPNAASILLRCLLFPLYPTLGSRNIERIVKVLSTLP